MNNFLQDLLLLKTANIEQVYQIVKGISFPLLTLAFILGAIWENIGDQNFIGLFKRMIIALFLISFGSTFLKSTVNLSFEISGKIISSVNNTNPITQLIERARKISQHTKDLEKSVGLEDKTKNAAKGLWESQAFVSKLLFGDSISSAVFIFSYAALMFLGQLFTIAYNFSYVSIPLLAALIVFPPTYSVANSISRTISWVFLMPIFTTITILLLSSSFSFPQDGASTYYFTSLENLINFCIMALMLLFVPTVVSGFLSGAGVLTAAETFTKTTVAAALSGGKSLALNGARSLGGKIIFGKDFGLATMAKVGVSRGLDKLGNRSMAARSRLSGQGSMSKSSSQTQTATSMGSSAQNVSEGPGGQESSSRTLTTHGASPSPSSNDRQSFISRSMDKSIIATDSVLNFKKNHIASKAVKTDLSKGSRDTSGESKAALFNKYKQSAHRTLRPLRPVDYQVSKIRGDSFNASKSSDRPAVKSNQKLSSKNNYKGRSV